MKKRFDIFWFGDNGPTWIEAVDTLEVAKAYIEEQPQGEAGSFGVLDRRTGNRLSFAAKLHSSGMRTRVPKIKDGQAEVVAVAAVSHRIPCK